MFKALRINSKEVKIPIIQGGMGIRISLGNLAKACMKNGIVSTISMAQIGLNKRNFSKDPLTNNLQALEEEIAEIRRSEPNGILGVNVMHAVNDYKEYVTFLSTQDIDFVISGAGLPLDLPTYLKGTNVKGAFIVSSARACKILLKSWDRKHNYMPEFIVCEGSEAGGHLGFGKEELENHTEQSLEEIVTEVKEVVDIYAEKYNKKIPVIAAGGIHNGKDIYKFLRLGCDGVQMGTRFIATEECDVSYKYKEKIVNAKEEDIVLTKSPAGLPARAIKNYLTEFIKTKQVKVTKCVNCLKKCNKVDIPYCITEQLGNSANGDERGLFFTGAKAYLIDKVETVETVINQLVREYKNELLLVGGK